MDTQFVCQMVVRRQVIVVTLNPNVVINGCAELVLPLEAVDGETQCLCSGCLHEADVRDVVCSILEGGRRLRSGIGGWLGDVPLLLCRKNLGGCWVDNLGESKCLNIIIWG